MIEITWFLAAIVALVVGVAILTRSVDRMHRRLEWLERRERRRVIQHEPGTTARVPVKLGEWEGEAQFHPEMWTMETIGPDGAVVRRVPARPDPDKSPAEPWPH